MAGAVAGAGARYRQAGAHCRQAGAMAEAIAEAVALSATIGPRNRSIFTRRSSSRVVGGVSGNETTGLYKAGVHIGTSSFPLQSSYICMGIDWLFVLLRMDRSEFFTMITLSLCRLAEPM